jgi:hypothetical protein
MFTVVTMFTAFTSELSEHRDGSETKDNIYTPEHL